MNEAAAKGPVIRKPLEYVALWQFLNFILLLCLVWSAVVLDYGDIFFRRPGATLDWMTACVISAGIIIVGFITVSHTYIQEKRILKGFIIVCSYCHKVQLEEKAWQQMELFVSDRTLAEFTHGICPTCYGKVISDLEKNPANLQP